jgi:CheY-like chemotaxis protein
MTMDTRLHTGLAATPLRLAPETPKAKSLVLVIEDDPDLAGSLIDMIEELGYRTAWAANGREALAYLAKESATPSLILVDLFMPLMGGIEFLHISKDNPKLCGIPRVIITAANDQMVGVKEDAPVLYKPLDREALTHLLKRHCHQHQMLVQRA